VPDNTDLLSALHSEAICGNKPFASPSIPIVFELGVRAMCYFLMGMMVSLTPSAIVVGLVVWRGGGEKPHGREGGRVVPFPRIPS
jgi:hypothetical protein